MIKVPFPMLVSKISSFLDFESCKYFICACILEQKQQKITEIYVITISIILIKLFIKNYQYSKRNKMSNTTVTRKKIQNYSYVISNAIGKGYSSQVFKGRNDITNEEVAIKVIDLKMLKNEINRVLLESQIEILKEIKTLPHILNLHDVFTTKNNTYIITELCDCDLNKTIKRKLTEAEACSYMEQIIQGYVNFASRDIIHRDLKPANILVTNQELKIADFGFAIKSCDASKYNKYNVGSPLYMAPQSLKKNEYSLKSDIWALGIIFYEMLTSSTPWKAKNEKQLLKKIENESIDDIIQIMAISNLSKSFLRKTLRLDKANRLNRQDLLGYKFNEVNYPNILMEKKFNSIKPNDHQKSLSIFDENLSIKIDKNLTINDNRANVKQICLRKDINNENKSTKLQIKIPNQSQSIKSINLQLFNPDTKKKISQKENPSEIINHFQSVTPSNQQKSEENKQQKKLITKMLISQIHYCRFLYKLLMKILQSSKKGLLQYSRAEVEKIMCSYVGVIKHKIDNVLSFNNINFLKVTYYEEYKLSSDFEKIIKIAREYKNRYMKDLIIHWSTAKINFSTEPTDNLIYHLHQLLVLRKDFEDSIIKNQREIIILDYLITSKFLFEFFKNGQNYEKFAKKSKIQDIVEGNPVQITKDLFQKIMFRAIQATQILQTSISPFQEAIII